jgi:hypothetical protein
LVRTVVGCRLIVLIVFIKIIPPELKVLCPALPIDIIVGEKASRPQ